MKHKKRKKQQKKLPIRLRWILLAVSVAGLLGWGGVLYKRHSPIIVASVQDHYARIAQWVTDRKQKWRQHIDKAKQLAVNQREEEPHIQFEFYNTLPEMQMASATPVNKTPEKEGLTRLFNESDVERELKNHVNRKTK